MTRWLVIAPVLFAAIALISCSLAETIRQCTCGEFEPCKQRYAGNFIPCADRCQAHVRHLGGDYAQLRSCLLQNQHKIRQTLNCEKEQLSGACAARPGSFVPKRYAETTKIAAFAYVARTLKANGVGTEGLALLAFAKKFIGCTMRCMDHSAGDCFSRMKLNCGLALPSDAALIAGFRNCAVANGLGAGGLHSVCRCAVGSGIRSLDAVCIKIAHLG